MDIDQIRTTIETHRTSPDMTIDEYVRSRRIQLGISVMDRERVYLDKRYWIILRDVLLGRNTDPASKVLLEALRAKVHSKQCICPISETLFLELLKQEDMHTRKKTAILIDELSKGVTLAPHPERVATELAHFLYSHTSKEELFPLDNLVWSRLSYVLGMVHPTDTAFDEAEEFVIQKAFFDHMWDCSLSEMIDLIGSSYTPTPNFNSLAQRLNDGIIMNASSIKNFQQAYKTEMIGCLGLFMSDAREVIEDMFYKTMKQPAFIPENEKREHEHQLLAFFMAAIEKKEVALALRTLHVGALCHAAVRWNKGRKLTGNDLFDFHHAEAAVGYCNVFLTEKPLQMMLQQNHLGLQRDFSCRIISSPDEAAEWFMN